MKTRHAREIRKGIREARNFNWYLDKNMSPWFIEFLYRAMIKRSTMLSFRTFQRTVGLPEE